MAMVTKADLLELKSYIEHEGALDSSNRSLLEDAISAGAGTYRCNSDLICLMRNLRNSGYKELAASVERYTD